MRNICLVLTAVLLCVSAFGQEKQQTPEEDHIFGHPEWKHPNKIEERIVEMIEDIDRCRKEWHLRADHVYSVGELVKMYRNRIRQDIINWVLNKIITDSLQGDYYFGVREKCPEAIAKICDRAAISERIKYLKKKIKNGEKVNETPDEVRKATQAQVGKAKKVLLKALKKDRKNKVREQCAGFLPDVVKDKEVVGALTGALLNDGWSIVRVMAVNSLKRIKDPSCLPALRKALEKDAYSRVRAVAADALVELADKGSLKRFVKGLEDGWSNVRVACIRALARFGTGEQVKPLVARLSDKEDLVREEAAQALGPIGDASALPALDAQVKNASGNEFENFRETIYRSVSGIGKRHKSAAKQAADILAKSGLSDKLFNPKMAAVRGLLQLKDKRAVKALRDVLLEATKANRSWQQLDVVSIALEHKVKDVDFLKTLGELVKSEKMAPMVKKRFKEALDELKK